MKYKVIGIMSGTSLDGLDIAYCEFIKGSGWSYSIIHSETRKYNEAWKSKLTSAYSGAKRSVDVIDKEFGKFIAENVLRFIKKNKLKPDFISSHGHTVFHRPDKGITRQIGDGRVLSNSCQLPVICDFRSGDVRLGGQGAPLVPLVDKILFSKYDSCLNLGGFANISYDDTSGTRIAFDICPVNIVLNELANALSRPYDKGGKIASTGKVHEGLLNKLNELEHYGSPPPKSLGREWVEELFFPVLDSCPIPVKDKLRTTVEHMAMQIGKSTSKTGDKKMLIAGGGSYNDFLIKRISAHGSVKMVKPDDQTIQFKEAMAFAFLGVLRMRNEINILKSVTGASTDSSGGKIIRPS